MKKLTNTFIITCITLILISCNQKSNEVVDSVKENSTQKFSTTYKASVFEQDKRAEEIEKLVPELEQLFKEYAKEKNIPGIAYGVVVDNELITSGSTGQINLETGAAPTINSVFRIASMTKSFTAMAILKLRDEGKLSLSDPVSDYIPEMSILTYLTADSPTITIKNLLTMTAGFPEDNPWGDRQLDESNKMLIDLIGGDVSFSNAPSFAYEYSNTGYALLGNIISKISGVTYQEYINSNILKPLGMLETYWEYEDVPKDKLVQGYRWEEEQWKEEPLLHDGSFGAMGGLLTSIEDFSKYVSFHLSAWPPRNEVDNGPVKRSSLREMQTPQFSRLIANATNFSGDDCAEINGYAYGLGIRENCDGLIRISHGGALPGFGSNYVFFPKYGVGIMAFCNLTYTTPWPLNKIGKALFESGELKPRKLPISNILNTRKDQVVQLIQEWNPELEAKILAENFYMDFSRERRMREIQVELEKAGTIESIEEINPYNQLRGDFKIKAENGDLVVYFTLTPEKDPKVQQLYVGFRERESK